MCVHWIGKDKKVNGSRWTQLGNDTTTGDGGGGVALRDVTSF